MRLLAKLIPPPPEGKARRRTGNNEPHGRGGRALLHVVHVPRFTAAAVLRGRGDHERGVFAVCGDGAGD